MSKEATTTGPLPRPVLSGSRGGEARGAGLRAVGGPQVGLPVPVTVSAGDEELMRAAVVQARRARDRHEVPVGAIVALDGFVVGRGCNEPIHRVDPTAHAEIVALRDAAHTVGNYRLTGAVMYVTVEPCAMCAGALVHARIARLVYGATELKSGAVRSAMQLLDDPSVNHHVDVVGGVLERECRELMRAFFAERRAGR